MKESRLEKDCKNTPKNNNLKDLASDGIITSSIIIGAGYYFGGYKGALIGAGISILLFTGAVREEYWR
ncbi:MAG: hypothetical protein Q7R52_05395 [archaeon]|nr:hypothetical protein [archaeon]